MQFRVAYTADIPQMMLVRLSVTENRLSDSSFITEEDYTNYLKNRGKGWVCEEDGKIHGVAIVDLLGNNVWALFVDPASERKGIGSQLQMLMLDWYFKNKDEDIWLSTEKGSRAESFYCSSGWKQAGFTKSGEMKFIMTKSIYTAARKLKLF
jgi:GNAT superfamily N-acetyltransferase